MDYESGGFVMCNPKVEPLQSDDPALVAPSLETAGIPVEPSTNDDYWRCGECSNMQPPDALQAWIEDSIQVGDSWSSVIDRTRRSRWNGCFTAWCIPCANRLLPASGLIRLVRRLLWY